MIQTKNRDVKTQVKHRLSRIEGQLRGIQKMIDADRDCKDIIQQLIAIRAAVQSASLNYMQDVANECMLNFQQQDDPEAQRAQMEELIQLLGKIASS